MCNRDFTLRQAVLDRLNRRPADSIQIWQPATRMAAATTRDVATQTPSQISECDAALQNKDAACKRRLDARTVACKRRLDEMAAALKEQMDEVKKLKTELEVAWGSYEHTQKAMRSEIESRWEDCEYQWWTFIAFHERTPADEDPHFNDDPAEDDTPPWSPDSPVYMPSSVVDEE